MGSRVTVTLLLACAALAGAGGRALAGTNDAAPAAHGGAPAITDLALPPAAGGRRAGAALRADLRLSAQRLARVLRGGLRLRVWVSRRADAILRLTLPRAAAARAHLRPTHGRGPVTIGLGTVGGLRPGSNRLRVRLSRAISRRLASLRAPRLGVRLEVMAAGRRRLLIGTATLT